MFAIRTIYQFVIPAQAVAWFKEPYPRDKAIREEMLQEAFENQEDEDWYPFEDLTDKFLVLLDSENGGFDAAANALALTS